MQISNLLYLLLIMPLITNAAMPVIDVSAMWKLAQEINQLERQYHLLQQTYLNAKEELLQTKQLVGDAEGHYGFGVFANSAQDLKNYEWAPNTWDRALQGLAGGNNERYQELIKEYANNNVILSDQEYAKGASQAKNNLYRQQVKANRAAKVQASFAYESINRHIQLIHDLANKIEEAPNTKAAIDLNSRLLAELAYIGIQKLRMEAVLNEQLARQQMDEIARETEDAKFNAIK